MADSRYNRTGYNRTGYIEGNAVRQNAVPAERPERREQQKTREQIQRERARRAVVRKNRQREQVMNRSYVVFLTFAMTICALICGCIIHLQADITTQLSEISEIETELETVKGDNDAQQNRIDAMMSIENVKQRAERLGMTYPSSDQIEYYTVDSNDYMNQYAEID